MPALRKIGRTWYSDLRIGGKRVRRPLSTDKVVAQERLAELMRDRDAVRYGHANRDVQWSEFRSKFLAYCDGSKAFTTAKRDRMSLQSLEKFQTLARLSDITPELLERWKAARRGAGKGAATINRDLQSVKSMMRRAKVWGYVRNWDASAVAKLKQTRGRLLFYTLPELQRLLAVCASRFSCFYDWTTICLLGARAGLRRSEIYWLAWQDVDLDRGVLSVVPKEDWQPKSGEQRHIPLPPELHRHLKGLARPTPWVIGERPSLAVMSAFFQKISRKAKLAGNIHTLRHTYASHLVQAGVDLFVVQKLLGHTDPKVTMIYAHLAPGNMDAAVKRLPRIWSQKRS